MSQIANSVRSWGRDVAAGWNRFWFEPGDPATLAMIRICTGRCCSTRTWFGAWS